MYTWRQRRPFWSNEFRWTFGEYIDMAYQCTHLHLKTYRTSSDNQWLNGRTARLHLLCQVRGKGRTEAHLTQSAVEVSAQIVPVGSHGSVTRLCERDRGKEQEEIKASSLGSFRKCHRQPLRACADSETLSHYSTFKDLKDWRGVGWGMFPGGVLWFLFHSTKSL